MSRLTGGSATNASGGGSGGNVNITQVGGASFSLGQQLAAASLPVVLTAAQITALTPPGAITNYALESGGNLATLAGGISASVYQTNIKQVNGVAVNVGVGAAGTGTQRVAVSSDSSIILAAGSAVIGHVITDSGSVTNATQSGTWNVATVTTVSNISQIASVTPTFGDINNSATETGTADVAPIGRYNLTQPTLTDTRYNQLQVSSRGELLIAAGVSGLTVTANAGTNLNTSALALESGGNLTTIASVVRAEDVASADGDKGIGALAIRKATPGNTSGTDGDYEYLQINGGRLWISAIIDTALPAGAALIGKVGIDQTTPGTTNGVSIAQIGANTVLAGNGATGTGSQRVTIANDTSAVANWGQGTTGSAVPVGSQYVAGIAKTSLPTAANDGNLTGSMMDKFGRNVVVTNAIRDIVGSQFTTINSSTAETTIVSAIASTFLDVTAVILLNTSSTPVRVDVRDTTGGSILKAFYLPAGDMRGVSFNTPWPQTSVNTNWTAQCSASITDVRICVQYIKNK